LACLKQDQVFNLYRLGTYNKHPKLDRTERTLVMDQGVHVRISSLWQQVNVCRLWWILLVLLVKKKKIIYIKKIFSIGF